jgi:acetamidase/formamidase
LYLLASEVVRQICRQSIRLLNLTFRFKRFQVVFTLSLTENSLISNLLELPDSKRQAMGEFPTACFYNQEYWDIKSF